MFNRFLKLIIILGICCASSACAGKSEPSVETEKATVKRTHNSRARVVELNIPKKDFVEASRNIDQIRRLRMVEVTASEETAASPYPEYRLFNIPAQSAYSLLGLEDGDVLVSANDYALNNPELFKQYVQVLHVEAGETFIEIRRRGEEIVLSYSFTK